MSRLRELTAASRGCAPDCCAQCVFWQEPRRDRDGSIKARWAEDVERRFGAWGRILEEGDEFRGVIQYGPSTAFPRARQMPAGPPDRGSALITCAYLDGDDPPGACERLLLEALADLKARGMRAVEAFGLHYPDEVPLAARIDAHHTLFDRTFLQRFGFVAVRTEGQVSLMRLELDALERPPVGVASRLLRRLRPAPLPAPGLAALRNGH